MDGQIRWIDSCGAVSRVADACDDGDACTADACIGETCTHAPLGTPECTGGAGCTPQAAKGCHGSAVVWLDSCGAPTDVIESCTDGDPCTEDLCDPATTACAHAPIDAPECAPCAPRASTACGEGGVRWVDGCGAPGDLAVACEDGDPCTTDSCDPATAACVHAWAVGDGCGEPAVCERAPSLVCLSGALVRLDACGRPAGISNGCLDHDPCTTDRCSEETLACVHEPLEPEQCAAGRGGPAPGEPIGDPGGVDAGGSDGSGFSAGTAEPDVQTVSWTEGCAAGGGAAPGLAVGLGVLLAWARRRRGA
jgi:hypothetical protein